MAKTDAKTLELIALVKKQQREIADIERPQWITNCSWRSVEKDHSSSTNLRVVNSLPELIGMAAFLLSRQATYAEAARLLGVVDPSEFTWCNFSVSDWMHDLALRVSQLQLGAKKSRLSMTEDRLNRLVSPEKRAELELEAIAAELEGSK